MEQNIIEGNKLIAEFMGFKTWTSETGCVIAEDREGYAGHIESFPFIQYHSSWDLLMPVVAKIETLGYMFEIRKSSIEVAEYKKGGGVLFLLHSDTKINAVVKGVIRFVTWYNTQP